MNHYLATSPEAVLADVDACSGRAAALEWVESKLAEKPGVELEAGAAIPEVELMAS